MKNQNKKTPQKTGHNPLEYKHSHLCTIIYDYCTVQKMKFSIKDFFSKCDQIHSFLQIWSHLLKKSLMENFIFFAVLDVSLLFTADGWTKGQVNRNAKRWVPQLKKVPTLFVL